MNFNLIKFNSEFEQLGRFLQLKSLNINDNELEDSEVARIVSNPYVLEKLFIAKLPISESTLIALANMDFSKL